MSAARFVSAGEFSERRTSRAALETSPRALYVRRLCLRCCYNPGDYSMKSPWVVEGPSFEGTLPKQTLTLLVDEAHESSRNLCPQLKSLSENGGAFSL